MHVQGACCPLLQASELNAKSQEDTEFPLAVWCCIDQFPEQARCYQVSYRDCYGESVAVSETVQIFRVFFAIWL